MNDQELALQKLLELRIDAKRKEDAATEARRAIDDQIAERVLGPDAGSASERIGDYRVTVKRNLNFAVDTDALKDHWAELPPAVAHAFRFKAEVRAAQYRDLSEKDARVAAAFVTSRPASAYVQVVVA